MRYIYLFVFLLMFTTGAYSQWSTDPSENTRVTNGGLLPQIITDGTGGAYIVYQDSPALLRQVWVQWLDKYGYVRFPENGIRVSSEERNQSPYYFLVSDSAGGVIVVFRDFREMNDETLGAVFAQRIDSSGAKLWGDAGVEIAPPRHSRAPASACNDGESGVFVFYDNGVDSTEVPELRVQRVSASGELLWPGNGVLITDEFTSANVSIANPAVSDGLGNAIILYSDSSGTKLQKMSEQGDFLWGEGVDIFSVGRQMIADNAGGAIVAGVRRESDETGLKYVVGAQRIDANGQVLWGEKGSTITENADDQTDVNVSTDNNGNSFVTWDDKRTGQSNVYAQKLSIAGLPQWQNDGVTVSRINSLKGIFGNGIAPVEMSSPVVIWRDWRNEDNDLFGQRLDSTGLRLWDNDDVPISTRAHYQRSPVIVSDNAGGAIVCWYETGVGSGFGIFAQQVSRNGNLGDVIVSVREDEKTDLPSIFQLFQNYPNPFNPIMTINYHVPEISHITLKIFDITGKEVTTLINKKQTPGAYQVIWNGKNAKGGEVASGIYLYQLRAGSIVKTRKALLIK